jgi:hypothetical protein
MIMTAVLVNPAKDFTKSDIGFFYPGVSASILLHEVFGFEIKQFNKLC